MGKQKGLVLLTGRLNGIIFYQSVGRYLTRAWDGHSKERIQNDPAFARVRESNREFGGAATVAKAFRAVFAEEVRHTGDRYLTGRLTQAFRNMCLQGSGERGQRSIHPKAHAELLKGFEFNAQQPLERVCRLPYSVQASPERNAVTLTVPDVAYGPYLTPPEGASHFSVVWAIGGLAEHVYNSVQKGYVPGDLTPNGLRASATSGLLPMDAPNGSLTLTAAFAGAPVLIPHMAVVAALGIQFYQQVNGETYPLVQGMAMRVVAVL